jgi:hypothetical protein
VLQIMRAQALLCQLQRSWVTTTDSRHGLRTYPNLLAGLVLERPNQAWVGDITYVRLPSCFIYLACTLTPGADVVSAGSSQARSTRSSRSRSSTTPLPCADRSPG